MKSRVDRFRAGNYRIYPRGKRLSNPAGWVKGRMKAEGPGVTYAKGCYPQLL